MVVGVAGCKQSPNDPMMVPRVDQSTVESTDFHWLPKQLRHTMDHLVHLYPDRHFKFYYYFATEEVNRNFYMTDPGLRIMAEMPVTNENALRRVEDHLYDVATRERGIFLAYDTTNLRRHSASGQRSPYFESFIAYVLPKDSADFRQLRVAIVEDKMAYSSERYEGPSDLKVYTLSEVDTLPCPVRGLDYFRNVIMNEVRDAEVFTLYDTGTVEVSFTVWGHRTHSPNLVRGFSTRDTTHEAYQADGEFIKAINDANVWWHDAQRNGQSVRSTMRMTFDVSTLKNQPPNP